MNQKSLMIVYGGISLGSPLRSQLGIDDVFALYLSSKNYHELLKERMKSIANEYDVLWNSDLSAVPTLADIKKELSEKQITWKGYRNIVFFPATAYFKNWESIQTVFLQIARSDTPVKSSTTPEFFGFPTHILEQADIQERSIDRLDKEVLVQIKEKCIDLDTRQGIFEISKVATNSRYFNEIIESGPYLIKKSKKKEKITNEYKFLRSLPAAVRPFYPAVGELNDLKGDEASYEIEFYPMFDCSRLLIHQSLPSEVFRKLLNKIKNYQTKCPSKKVGKEVYQNKMEELFIKKLETRVREFQSAPFYNTVTVLCERISTKSLEKSVEELVQKLKSKIATLGEQELSFAHGDLCFSNILYDHPVDQMKLIDPKGSSTEEEAYLPWYYDLAKLSHSFLGGYDLILNDLSEIRFKDNLSLESFNKIDKEYYQSIQSEFISWVNANGWDLELVRLCEASLFFSMLTFHIDEPKHVLLQILRGQAILREMRAT